MQMYLDWELSREEQTFIFCNNHKLRCDTYPAFELFDELSALKLYQAKLFFLWIKKWFYHNHDCLKTNKPYFPSRYSSECFWFSYG